MFGGARRVACVFDDDALLADYTWVFLRGCLRLLCQLNLTGVSIIVYCYAVNKSICNGSVFSDFLIPADCTMVIFYLLFIIMVEDAGLEPATPCL